MTTTYPIPNRRRVRRTAALAAMLILPALAACGSDVPQASAELPPPVDVSSLATAQVVDSMLPDVTEAVGTAEALLSATLSTKLMATVLAVQVQVGDVVREGQPLLTLDVRDVNARAAQAAGQLAGAEAMLADAERQATRMRALFADSAAPRVQLDAAEAGLARAQAAVSSARGGVAEAEAMRSYGALRAPFNGVVTQRLVDPGDFAAPGMPLLTLQQSTKLRVSALVPPLAATTLRRGQSVQLRVEGVATTGTIEGIVAAPSGGMFTVNVVVNNANGDLPTGGAATTALPGALRPVRLVPTAAISREGDLTGVRVVVDGAIERRWVRVGRDHGTHVELLSGLDAGMRVVLSQTASEAMEKAADSAKAGAR